MLAVTARARDKPPVLAYIAGMPSRLASASAAALALVFLAACGPSGRHVRTGPALPARPFDCAVTVALDGKVDRPYEVVGLVEAEGTGGMTELIPILQREACALGADGLVQLRQAVGSGYTAVAQAGNGMGQGMGSSYSTYHATATAVRFKTE